MRKNYAVVLSESNLAEYKNTWCFIFSRDQHLLTCTLIPLFFRVAQSGKVTFCFHLARTDLERERENQLFDQWVMLTEERNAVLAPAANSGVPGAPASWWVFAAVLRVIWFILCTGLGVILRGSLNRWRFAFFPAAMWLWPLTSLHLALSVIILTYVFMCCRFAAPRFKQLLNWTYLTFRVPPVSVEMHIPVIFLDLNCK